MSLVKEPSEENKAAKLQVDIDRLSLQQALRDFELANARVIDLTGRVVEAERRNRDLEHEIARTRLLLDNAQTPNSGPPSLAGLAEMIARKGYSLSKRIARRLLR